jgi:hypothetical protein
MWKTQVEIGCGSVRIFCRKIATGRQQNEANFWSQNLWEFKFLQSQNKKFTRIHAMFFKEDVVTVLSTANVLTIL